jgi:hypothetical protein
MEKDAVKFAEKILEKYKNEEDRILLCNMILTRVIKDVNITKVQASGVPELIACKQLGFSWNGKTVHGVDAVDKEGRNIELKTYRRVTNSNRVSIMYSFPPREPKEASEDYRKRMIKHYRTNTLFSGGHYWVSFDQKKENVLGYYFVESETVAKEIGEYLERNPTSKSKNFGGVICSDCHRCHIAERFAKKTFVSKGQPNIICSK